MNTYTFCKSHSTKKSVIVKVFINNYYYGNFEILKEKDYPFLRALTSPCLKLEFNVEADLCRKFIKNSRKHNFEIEIEY